MMQSRHIVRSVLCCLLCLTVCAVPALAGNYSTSLPGFVYPDTSAQFLYTSGSISADLLQGYFPSSFGVYENGDTATRYLVGSLVPWEKNPCTLTLPADTYIEILFPVEVFSTVTVTPHSMFGMENATLCFAHGAATSSFGFDSYDIHFCADGEYTPLTKDGDYWVGIPSEFDVNRYWGFRYYFASGTKSGSLSANYYNLVLSMPDYNKYSFVEDVQRGIYEEVVVNTGVLAEINGKLTAIQTSTTAIQQDVSEIKNGLQDSNSSIWQSFKDSVSGLFVPSSADLEGVINGFDQLAQDKLGGAYQTIGLVNGGVQSVVNKIKNPGDSPGVEFPGISVPLGGDDGTVILAASQTVTIPEKIANVLYPVSGVIIPIVCVIWTIRQCTDMVECFMSGMSYAEFLHRNSDEEDDEV